MEAVKLSIILDIDQSIRNIQIIGLPKHIPVMIELIHSELQKIENKEYEKLLASLVQWEYFDNEEWKKFDESINKVSIVYGRLKLMAVLKLCNNEYILVEYM